MRISILLIGCLLTFSTAWGNPASTRIDAAFAEGREKAAAGDIDGALTVYEALTKAHPKSRRAFAHLGSMQLLNQHYPDAVKSFQQAIMLGDDGARSFIGIGMAYLHMGQLGPARAAFVEAKSRGLDNPKDIDDIIGWIDAQPNATTHR